MSSKMSYNAGLLTTVTLAALGVGAAGSPDSLTAEDRNTGVEHLEKSREAVMARVRGLSPAQWIYREAPGRWSVAEIVEHLALAEDVLFENVRRVMKEGPGRPERDYQGTDRMVLTLIPDRSNKATAAAPTVPAGRWTPSGALDQFRMRRARTVEFLRSTGELREHVSDGPLGQPMDAYQWLLFIAAHTERHSRQIAEVMAQPGFPGGAR